MLARGMAAPLRYLPNTFSFASSYPHSWHLIQDQKFLSKRTKTGHVFCILLSKCISFDANFVIVLFCSNLGAAFSLGEIGRGPGRHFPRPRHTEDDPRRALAGWNICFIFKIMKKTMKYYVATTSNNVFVSTNEIARSELFSKCKVRTLPNVKSRYRCAPHTQGTNIPKLLSTDENFVTWYKTKICR